MKGWPDGDGDSKAEYDTEPEISDSPISELMSDPGKKHIKYRLKKEYKMMRLLGGG